MIVKTGPAWQAQLANPACLRDTLNVDPERAGQRMQTAAETLANRLEFPLITVAIHFAKDHRGFSALVFTKVITGQFLAVFTIHNTHEGIGNHAKVLLAAIRFMNGHRKG